MDNDRNVIGKLTPTTESPEKYRNNIGGKTNEPLKFIFLEKMIKREDYEGVPRTRWDSWHLLYVRKGASNLLINIKSEGES